MLAYKLLKNHAGVLLIGDYTTLDTLRNVIHDVNEQSCIIRDKDGTFIALAYDVRKAYSGERKIVKPPKEMKEIGVRYGVEILWPVLLVQCRMLRVGLGFFNSTKIQQALTFALESVIEDALKEDFGSKSSKLIEFWLRIDPSLPWPEEKLDSRGAQFCLWSKKERYDKFVGLLASFDPMYEYFYDLWINQDETVIDLANRHFTRNNLVSPEDLDALDDTEWVDPKW